MLGIGTGVTFFAVLFTGQWLLPPIVDWARTWATFSGAPEALARIRDDGAWTIATLAAGGVFTLGLIRLRKHGGVLDSVHDQRGGTTDLTRVVFGRIPQPAPHFQARPMEARALRRALGGRGPAASVALLGPRGAGKTQVAAAHARVCDRQGYDLVAWINADSGPVTGLAELARELGLGVAGDPPEHLAAAAVRALERDDRVRRLVVFDNIDDPDAVVGFLPSRGATKVIITSNRQEFTAMAGVNAVSVGMFSPEQGRDFLCAATGLADGPDAGEVGVHLGWLPLGLAQAGAYIARNKLSYSQYLTALSEQNLDETLRRQAGADHPGVLKATQLSVTGLSRDDPSGECARLLCLLAVLSGEGVSRTLLTKAESALGLAGGLGHALDVLATASLITLSGAADAAARDNGDHVVVSVHRLTARAIRHQASRAGARPALADAVTTASDLLDVLTRDLPHEQVALRRAELDELVAHILAVGTHTPDQPVLLTQCDWAGNALREAGDLTRAIPVLAGTLADRLRVLGPEHPDTLGSRNSLAYAFRAAGQLDEAIELYREVVSDRLRVLGAEHPDTLASRHNLAVAYQSAGRLDEAIDLYQRVLADYERVLDSRHPKTLASRNDLANAYRSAGLLIEAIELFETVIADQRRVLGVEHPDTLASRHNLAVAYQSAGRLDEAIDLHQEVVSGRLRVLGADHPDTMISRNNLAGAYEIAGRLDQAISLYQQVLADCERVLSLGHPFILTVRNNLARNARAQRTI